MTMKTIVKKGMLWGALAVLLLSATGCSEIVKRLDVIGRGSIAALEAVASAAPDQVQRDAEHGGWSLAAPDGAARFIVREDWSKSARYDVLLELDAAPFLNAGLDPKKLPENYTMGEGVLQVGRELGGEAPPYEGEPTLIAVYEQIVDRSGEHVSYHAALDHFGVMLGDGNMFEWAKDLEGNDKDIVFVLNPAPLMEAGVDPSKVEGWVFAKVPTDGHGGTTEAEKFLKPFDLQ